LLRLIADTVLSSQEEHQIQTVWQDVVNRKRIRNEQLDNTVFVELRSRIDQMVRAMLQVLRPAASDPLRYVRKSELFSALVPKIAPKPEIAEAIARINADQMISRGVAIVPPKTVLLFANTPFGRHVLSAFESATSEEQFAAVQDIWSHLTRQERVVFQRYYANSCPPELARVLGWK
jgi:hypothetical protein